MSQSFTPINYLGREDPSINTQDSSISIEEFAKLQKSLSDLQEDKKKDLDNYLASMYEDGMDYISRGRGTGPYKTHLATQLAKHDRIGIRASMDNYVKHGLTFITRPHLNLNPHNLKVDRVLNLLNTDNENSIQFAIRCMLDTDFAGTAGFEKAMKCPFIDWRSPFFTWITNNMQGISGGPTFQLDVDTEEGGYFGEAQSTAKASDSYTKPFDLNIEVIDPYGGPIAAAIFYWTYAMDAQYRGFILPYPGDIEEQVLNYTVSIYRFLTDITGIHIVRAYKYTGCFPISRPGASLADFTRDTPFIEQARSFSIGFRCNHVDENDPIIFKEFNDLVERYYPVFNKGGSAISPDYKEHRKPMTRDQVDTWAKSLGLIRNTFMPDYNYTGIPYITFDPSGRGPRVDFFREAGEETVADVRARLQAISDNIYYSNKAYNEQISLEIKNYYERFKTTTEDRNSNNNNIRYLTTDVDIDANNDDDVTML